MKTRHDAMNVDQHSPGLLLSVVQFNPRSNTSMGLMGTGLCSPQDTENPYFSLSINWALPQQSIL